jgi:hypothetical protein
LKSSFRNNLSAAMLLLVATGSIESVADNNQYRWENSRGEAVFSDRPPPNGIDYEVVGSQSTLNRVVSEDEGADPLGVNPVDNSDKERNAENLALCEGAKMNLAALAGTNKVSVRNDQGEVVELSPEGREIARQTAEAKIDIYCE